MKRQLLILALLLAVSAVVAWFLVGRDDSAPTIPSIAEPGANVPVAPVVVAPAPTVPGSPATPAASTTPAPQQARVASAVMPGQPLVRTTPVPRPVLAVAPPSAPASVESTPRAEGEQDLEAVRFMLRDFRTRMGENPVGSNAEIMRAVMGGNEAKARLGPPPGQELSEGGELLDRWGTPYFFHQISSTSMEVRSAGPDRKLWTPDDLVTK